MLQDGVASAEDIDTAMTLGHKHPVGPLHTGSGEEFYRIASEPAVEAEPSAPIDFDRVREAATQTGAIELLGPPPF